jgi:hypothetical protein
LARFRRYAGFLILLLATPAEARCHSIWHYPWPQSCNAGRAALMHRTWYVEVVKPPPETDQQEHDAAMATHKAELNFLLAHVHDPDSEFSQQRAGEKERNGE